MIAELRFSDLRHVRVPGGRHSQYAAAPSNTSFISAATRCRAFMCLPKQWQAGQRTRLTPSACLSSSCIMWRIQVTGSCIPPPTQCGSAAAPTCSRSVMPITLCHMHTPMTLEGRCALCPSSSACLDHPQWPFDCHSFVLAGTDCCVITKQVRLLLQYLCLQAFYARTLTVSC